MKSLLLLLAATLSSLMTSCSAQNVDATRTPGTSGSDVVNAVVDVIKANCIYSEDRQFLRRLAYVESLDGTDTDTYKAGYYGGIWKVGEDMFNATTSCAPVIRPTCDLIRQTFGIDWTTVKWSDLQKPLYSALGAVLYLIQRTNNATVPATIAQQQDLWSHYYHFGAARRNFSMVASALDYDCGDEMDLAFILDSSGSIVDSDFSLSLEFVAKVVEAMNIPSVVRVATLIFEDTPTVQFMFNTHSTKSQVLSAIRSILRSSGGTATGLALDAARTELFTTVHGARPSKTTKRVAVLITDGQSNSLLQTSQAAQRLRASGVTVFSIGVGGYDLVELKAVASDPECTHVFTLSDFSQIESIIAEIQRSTCKAHTTLTHTDSLEKTETNKTTIATAKPSENETLVVNVTCGIVDVYVSYTNPNPNPALYAEKYTARDGHPAYLTSQSSSNGQTVYMTVIGTKLPPTTAGLNNCTDFKYVVGVVPVEWKVQCCNGLECRDCTPDQLRKEPNIRDIVCEGPVDFPNPCTPEALLVGKMIWPYPYDSNSFIRCDYRGDPYVTLCPNRQTFNPSTMTCGYDAPGARLERLPAEYPNPCTPAHIEAQYFYFEYTPDRRKYIHCDPWGDAWLEQCPEQEVWSEDKLACIVDRPHNAFTTQSPGHSVANPCTKEALAGGHFYFPYPCDHTRFIHCDISGNFWVQFCPGGTFYDPATYICVVGDPQQDSGC